MVKKAPSAVFELLNSQKTNKPQNFLKKMKNFGAQRCVLIRQTVF